MDLKWPGVSYTPALGHPCYNFEFAGWYFSDTGLRKTQWDPIPSGFLRLFAILHNPEGNAYLSYHGYKRAIPGGIGEDAPGYGKKWAAAWLIAHWYEHYIHNCPCQIDDAKPSHFRYAFIDALLDFCGVA